VMVERRPWTWPNRPEWALLEAIGGECRTKSLRRTGYRP
jgi:hypothetical protein